MKLNHCLVNVLGSPRVDGDDEEEDVDDIDNEFNYAQGNSKARQQWQGDDTGLSSSSRHESQQPIPLLTNGQPVSDNVLMLSFLLFWLYFCFINLLFPYLGVKCS